MKKFISAALAAVLALSLAACGQGSSSSAASNSAADASQSSQAAASDETAADFTGDGFDESIDYASLDGTTIKVAASPTPHAEILAVAGDILAQAGIKLEVVEFTDYVQPNMVTESGEVDANYFQHQDYLNNFNEENGTHLVSVAEIHYEPLGLYPGKTKSIDELADGAKISVPNDTSNEARALQLLAAQGLIELDPDAGLTATKNDITSNPKNLEIVEMEAAQLPRTLADVDMAVINGNYATQAGFSSAKDALAAESADSEAAQIYPNVLVVKEGRENDPAILALAAALKSEAVRSFIDETYGGAVVPLF
ncbi:MetQ/NlpA family ABC transporter substrate-binding protein [Subdoligranulum sp. DSM 109015]|uniref:MetQ/NlpA family ABC transporter substrate-binding protein n=1 Tax=Gemmiger gallinarum TaxID=2779354 RepID=A0ABR9R6K4_9FIRM|nr:MetQ/NlpA family ABC transporter substrate-binding protein [Gemmiger gallinarum]MBE5038395.1 MetQ/NlpA family ABC transporter substrate-binding protein [Gemmiger gallinarum]